MIFKNHIFFILSGIKKNQVEIIGIEVMKMKEKLLGFVKENGFLLFLFICVGVVAFSTIYVVNKDQKQGKEELLTKKQMEDLPKKLNEKDILEESLRIKKEQKDNPKLEASKEKAKKEISEEEIKQNEIKDNRKKEAPKHIKEVKKQAPQKIVEEKTRETFSQGSNLKKEEQNTTNEKLMMPVQGKIITEFTKDNLIYSKTLDEWRSHPGIDIAAKVGEKVKAPLDGRVKEISEDALWGKVVILDHGNGLITKFANLGDSSMISKGLNVKRGDYIATVGKSADIEMLMETHLHFEVIKDGKLVDPRSIP